MRNLLKKQQNAKAFKKKEISQRSKISFTKFRHYRLVGRVTREDCFQIQTQKSLSMTSNAFQKAQEQISEGGNKEKRRKTCGKAGEREREKISTKTRKISSTKFSCVLE